jgi:hypothetical protein
MVRNKMKRQVSKINLTKIHAGHRKGVDCVDGLDYAFLLLGE